MSFGGVKMSQGIGALFLAGSLFISGCGFGSKPEQRSLSQPGDGKIYKVGQKAKIENLAITVNKVSRENKPDNPQKDMVLVIDSTVENVGGSPEYVSDVQFVLKDLEGYAHKKATLPEDKQNLEGEIRPGEKLRGEIAWEVPREAAGLEMVFDEGVLVRKIKDNLVNTVTVVSRRQGGGQAVFAVNNLSL